MGGPLGKEGTEGRWRDGVEEGGKERREGGTPTETNEFRPVLFLPSIWLLAEVFLGAVDNEEEQEVEEG